jgi:hypothetical protein
MRFIAFVAPHSPRMQRNAMKCNETKRNTVKAAFKPQREQAMNYSEFTKLAEIQETLTPHFETVCLKGRGASSFIYAVHQGRAVEISEGNHGFCLEFWDHSQSQDAPSVNELAVARATKAVREAQRWLLERENPVGDFDDPDAVKRWNAASTWYANFEKRYAGWDFLRPMADLSGWIGEQTFGSQIYPGTSHEWLCVAMLPDFPLDHPFFACCTQKDGKFDCHLWNKVGGMILSRDVVPLKEDRVLFSRYVDRLAVAESENTPRAWDS